MGNQREVNDYKEHCLRLIRSFHHALRQYSSRAFDASHEELWIKLSEIHSLLLMELQEMTDLEETASEE